MKRVLVACGTGIATSTVVAKKLEEAFRARGVAAVVLQCKASEVVSAAAVGVDLIVSTTQVPEVANVPSIRTLSFLTGIGLEADIERIISLLKG